MNVKKPIVSLDGVPRPNPEPLRTQLATLRKLKADIADGKKRLTALETEVREFLENTSPDDAERLQIISAKQLQLQILPAMIRRVERQIENELAPALLREVEGYRAGLKQFYVTAHGLVADELAKTFRRFFADRVDSLNGEKCDRARAIALQTDDCEQIAARIREAESIRIPDQPRSNRPGDHDAVLSEAGDAILALAEIP